MKIAVFDEKGLPVGTPSAGGSGGTSDATYIVQIPDATLPNAQDMKAIADEFGGVLLKVTDGGVIAHAVPNIDYIAQMPNNPLVVTIGVIEVGAGGVGEIIFDLGDVWYEELELSIAARTAVSSTSDDIVMQFNDDVAYSEYRTFEETANVSGLGGYENLGVDGDYLGIGLGMCATGDNAPADYFSNVHVKIINPVNAFVFRTVTFAGFVALGDNTGDMHLPRGGGLWTNSQGIIKIKLVPLSETNFLQGSTFILKGIVSPFPIV